MRDFIRKNGLSLAMFALFLGSIVGHGLSGWRHHNEQQQEHGQEQVALGAYLSSGDFLESVFENWESEFLQMSAFLILSIGLRQKGSSESKPMPEEGHDHVDDDPRRAKQPDSPGPVHRGGLALALYSRSLSIALIALFVFSFLMHALHGQRLFNEEQLQHGGAVVSVLGYVATSRFWFESFQNWQSEFLSVGVLVLLSVWLRQKGSPQSKPVHAPHAETGES